VGKARTSQKDSFVLVKVGVRACNGRRRGRKGATSRLRLVAVSKAGRRGWRKKERHERVEKTRSCVYSRRRGRKGATSLKKDSLRMSKGGSRGSREKEKARRSQKDSFVYNLKGWCRERKGSTSLKDSLLFQLSKYVGSCVSFLLRVVRLRRSRLFAGVV
jgi:hypothetical protein